MYPLSTDGEFSFYLAEVLSLSNGGGASTGEVLRAASQVVAGDIESFYTEFKFLADRMHSIATAADARKFPVSVRDAHFRASTYYRAADFLMHGNVTDPRLTALWDAQLADFGAAIKLLPIPGEKISIRAAAGYTIPMYFFRASPDPGHRAPTLLVGSGYDGSQEALYHSLGVHVLARGWNFATYEGPGQPTVRREKPGWGFGSATDWSEVVTPAVDYLARRADVDMGRLALVGLSFGGSLAPIAATKEHRFAAVVCIDGLFSMRNAILDQIQQIPDLVSLFKSGNATGFNGLIKYLYDQPDIGTEFRWLIDQSLWSFNTTNAFDWLTQLGKFDLTGVFPNVTVPVFIGAGQHDTLAGNEADVAWQALGSDKGYYYKFQTQYGAGEHCQIGAEAQMAMVSLDWLTGVFEGNWLKGNGTA